MLKTQPCYKENQLFTARFHKGKGATLLWLLGAFLSPSALSSDYQLSQPQISALKTQIQQGPKSKTAISQMLKGTQAEIAITGKLGPFIRGLRQRARTGATLGKEAILDSTMFVRTRGATEVLAYINLNKVNENVLAEMQSVGVEIEVVNKPLKKVQAWIDLDRVDALANIAAVNKITTPNFARPRGGSRTTQGDAILHADQLRAAGFSGRGVKVGIVSDGANNWTAARDSGDLPANLTRYGSCSRRGEDARNCSPELTCNEGTAMAEIVHDLAPDAEIAVAAVSTSLEFIQRINQLATSFKADIIVDDLGFYGEPYFEDGDLAQAVAALPENVLYISAAGNSANSHYEDNFRLFPGQGLNLHDFGTVAGQAGFEANGFIIGGGDGVVTLLQWEERFDSPSSDYDLYIVDDTALVGASAEDQASGAPAIEATCTYNPSSTDSIFYALVDRFSGSSRRLEMFFLGSLDTQFNTSSGSVFGHPGVERAVAVGAINATEPGNDNVTFYSSRGPARIRFPSSRTRTKPDLMAIDGVSVTGAGGFSSTFFGTSAAAPHVAGIAAQLMSAPGNVKANDVREALQKSAVDLGSPGRDNTYGFGRVDGLAALEFIKTFTIAPLLMLLLGDEKED